MIYEVMAKEAICGVLHFSFASRGGSLQDGDSFKLACKT